MESDLSITASADHLQSGQVAAALTYRAAEQAHGLQYAGRIIKAQTLSTKPCSFCSSLSVPHSVMQTQKTYYKRHLNAFASVHYQTTSASTASHKHKQTTQLGRSPNILQTLHTSNDARQHDNYNLGTRSTGCTLTLIPWRGLQGRAEKKGALA